MNHFNENQIHNLFRPGGCIYRQGDLFIFCSRFLDGVFIWDCIAKKCSVIVVSNDEYNSWLYLNYIRIDKILYFIPYKARYMMSYHLETQRVNRISVRTRHSDAFYHKAVYYRGNIYLFPEFGKVILIYNLKEKTTVYHKLEIQEKKEDVRFFWNIYQCHEKVWFATGRTGKLYCYNLELNDCTEFIVDTDCANVVDITGDGNEVLFILMENGAVIARNVKSGENRFILKGNNQTMMPYFRICYSVSMIWLIPQEDNILKVIDVQGDEICKWDFSNLRDLSGRLFEEAVLEGDEIIIASYQNGRIVLADTKKCRLEILHIELRAKEIFDILMNGKKCVYDSELRNYGTHIWKELEQ